METTYCPNCGGEIRPTAKFCSSCGTSLTEDIAKVRLLKSRYKISKPLGQGGMGSIFLAEDTWQQGEHVVIQKLDTALLPPSERAEAIHSFKKKVGFLAGLKHINLPVMLDYFSLEHSEYIVTERVDGRDLEQILVNSPEPLPEEQVIEWASQLCDALSHIHSQEPPIIHRDVKPQNIMQSTNNVIKLMDFGVARRYKVGKKQDTTPLGTPGYAPPEQYGKAQTDARSDIYALGVTLYVLLTKYDPQNSSFKFPPLRQMNPHISIQTEAVIHKAIQLDPTNRFQSAVEMKDALLTGNLKFIERHPSWSVWEQEIYQALQKFGRVRTTELNLIPDKFCSVVGKKYVSLHPEQDIEHSSDFQEMWLNEFEKWEDLSKRWKKMSQALSQIGQETVEKFVQQVQNLLSLQREEQGIQYNRLLVYNVDVTSILGDLRVPPVLPLVIFRENTFTNSDLEDLRQLIDQTVEDASRVAFLILFSDEQNLQQTKHLLTRKLRQVYAYNVVLLAYDELFKIATAKDPKRVFRSIVLTQVDLRAISPFVITGPTSEDNFFGREQEMRTIVDQAALASFIVIGGRRVGKSSVLLRLHKIRLPKAGFYSLFYDCSYTSTYEDFLTANIDDWQPQSPSDVPLTFGDLLKKPPAGKRLVILLDEADKLVPADRNSGWKLFNTLRAFSNAGRGQIIFSGERMLYATLSDSFSPWFNFANKIALGPLDFRAVEELVTLPMKQLEIELVEVAQIVKRIWDFTSGHPNVIQRLCHRLIESLNVQETRCITLDEVNTIINDPGFQEEDFLQTYWAQTTPLEQIVSLLMAQETKAYHLQDVLDLLAVEGVHPEPEVLKAALDRLVMLRSILKRSNIGYEFAVTAFPRILANTITIEDLLIVLKSQYRKNPMEVA